MFLIRPREMGVLQTPPLPLSIELGPGVSEPPGLADRIAAEIRDRLLVTTEITMVPNGTVPRETYKSKLVDYTEASGAVVNA
jgi:phenylacetate-CoA ligase